MSAPNNCCRRDLPPFKKIESLEQLAPLVDDDAVGGIGSAWTQTALPSKEEMNNDMALYNERSQKTRIEMGLLRGLASDASKSKKMKIKSRETGYTHVPYWNVFDSLISSKVDPECMLFYDQYLYRVSIGMHKLRDHGLEPDINIAYACGIPNGFDGLHHYPIVGTDLPLNTNFCDCVYEASNHRNYLEGYYYQWSKPLFDSRVNFQHEFDIFHGDETPSTNHVRARYRNKPTWTAFDIPKSSTTYESSLFYLAFEIAKSGSWKGGFEMMYRNTLHLERGEQGYTLTEKDPAEFIIRKDALAMAGIRALYHGGVSTKAFPTTRRQYVNLFKDVPFSTILKIQRSAGSMYCKGNPTKRVNYATLKRVLPEMLPAYRFLRSVLAIYDHIRHEIKFGSKVYITLSDLVLFGTFYMRSFASEMCKHDNPRSCYAPTPYKGYACEKGVCDEDGVRDTNTYDLEPHMCHSIDYPTRSERRGGERTTRLARRYPTSFWTSPCECTSNIGPQKKLHRSPTDLPDINDLKATSYTGFFEFMKDLWKAPSTSTSQYPEEGYVPAETPGFMPPINDWLTKAIDYFFTSFKAFLSDSLSDFQKILGNIWESIKDAVMAPLKALGSMLGNISAPIIKLLRKALTGVGLGWFITGRNLVVDFYSCLVGFFIFTVCTNPAIKVLIMLFYLNHFAVIPDSVNFLKYLKREFFVKQHEEVFDELDEDVIEPTSLTDFLVYLGSTSFAGVICKVVIGIIITTSGVAATNANKGSLARIVIDCFKNLSFVSQGITGISKIIGAITSFIPEVFKWIRARLGKPTPEDIQAEKLAEEKVVIGKKIIEFMTFVKSMNTEAGYLMLKRSHSSQAHVVEMYPHMVRLYKYSIDPTYSDCFPISLLAEFRMATKNYTKLLDIVYRVTSYGDYRQTPFHIQLFGPPGIGKSTLISSISDFLHQTYFKDNARNTLIFTRGNTDHFDGYNNQPIMVQDDMFSVDDYEKMSELLPLISNCPLVVPMANLEDKGTFFDSKFIISTTNTVFPNTASVRCDEAIWRRRHMLVKVTIDDDVMDKSTSKFDLGLFNKKYVKADGSQYSSKERMSLSPHLKFTLISPTKRPSTVTEEPLTGEKTDFETLDDVVAAGRLLPSGFCVPLTDISFPNLMAQLELRYSALCKEEELIASNNSQKVKLNSCVEVYRLLHDLMDVRADISSPLLESFRDFDFCDTHEAHEQDPETPDDLASEVLGQEFVVEDEDDVNLEELFDDTEPTSDHVSTLMESSESALYLHLLTTQDYEWIRTNDIALRKILNKYVHAIPAPTYSLLNDKIETSKNADPEKQRREKLYKNLLGKVQRNERLSLNQEARLATLTREFNPGAAQPSTSAPVASFVPNVENPYYVPFAGEIPSKLREFDGRAEIHLDDDEYEVKTTDKHDRVLGVKYYQKAKTTVCFDDDVAYLSLEDQIMPNVEYNMEDNVCKATKKAQFLHTTIEEHIRDYAMFSPIKFNSDRAPKSESMLRKYPRLLEQISDHKHVIDQFPRDFLERIDRRSFPIFYKQVFEHPSGTVVNYAHDTEDKFCFRESSNPEGRIGVFTIKQWNEIWIRIRDAYRENLNYTDKQAFEELLRSDPRATNMENRPYAGSYMSPLYISKSYRTYVHAFLHLPRAVRYWLLHLNHERYFQSIRDVKWFKMEYSRAAKYMMAKYHSYLHKRPSPLLVGFGDAVVTLAIAAYAGICFYYIRQIFKKFFGFGDVKSTSRILFKKEIPRNLKPTSAQNISELRNSVTRNLVRISHPKAGSGNAIGIDGRSLLVNLHWARHLLELGEDFDMQYLPTTNSLDWWTVHVKISDIVVIPNSDACIMYSPDFRMFGQIIHRFLKQEDIDTYEIPSDIFATYYDNDLKIYTTGSKTSGFIYSMDVPFLSNKVNNVIQYDSPRLYGSSGSPLYADYAYTQGRCIIGIQSASSKDRSYANVVTQEQLNQYMPKSNQIVHEGPVHVDDIITPTSELITEHLVIVGSVPPQKVAGIVGKTAFTETILANEFPSTRIPAILNAFDHRVPTGTHPLQHSVNKFGRNVIGRMDQNIVDRAVDDITTLIQGQMRYRKLRVFGLGSAIAGIQEEGFEKINNKTSPGIPWIWDKNLPGKKDWIQFDTDGNVMITDVLRETFAAFDVKLQKGIIPANSFYEFPKDELRPTDKVIGPPIKTRSITVMNFVLSLLYRRYCLDLEAQLHKLADGNFPLCVGINPESMDWFNMYRNLANLSDRGNDFDISNWDGHFPPWLFTAVCNVFNNLYNDKYSLAREALFANACFGYTNFLDCVLQKCRGMPSGFAGTATVNTLGHFILFYCFYQIQCLQCDRPISIIDFKSNVAVFLYGDDVIFTLSQKLKEEGISSGAFVRLYQAYGWPITSASKDSDPSIEKPLMELQFLKRSFKFDHVLSSLVYGAIDEEVINGLLHWQRKTANTSQQFFININEAMEFAYAHGHQYYNRIRHRIQAVVGPVYKSFILPSYPEMRERILGRYFGK